MTVDTLARQRHSRSALAGYDPTRVETASVLVVGAGALGQNLLLDLALAGIGTLIVVDHDAFEDHNRTRSPCYPTASEQARLGMGKASVAAHKIVPLMTARRPLARYAATRVQDVGDAAVAQADVVCSAVDNAAARHYLAERCRAHGKTLVEAGFEGSRLNLGVFGPDPGQPCYRCIVPSPAGAFSCDRYARAAAQARIAPAIQSAAAALAALQAEQAIETLHGRAALVGKRMFGDIRTLAFRVRTLRVNPTCAGAHAPIDRRVDLDLGPPATVAQLAEAARSLLGPSRLRLPAQFIGRIPCASCARLTDAMAPEWRWEADPRCQPCGGPFPTSHADAVPFAHPVLDIAEPQAWAEIAEKTLAELGLGACAAIEAERLGDGRHIVLRLPGASVTAFVNVPEPNQIKEVAE